MNEGWLEDDYLVLFSQAESEVASARYGLNDFLPGYTLIGLRGWDDFILLDPAGGMLCVPTVPLDSKQANAFALPTPITLAEDERLRGRIKWYVTPLVFGGSPQDEANLTWVTHEQHAQLVRWWNQQYKAFKAAQAPGA